MRRILGIGVGLAVFASLAGLPTAVFADGELAAADMGGLGTVATDAVTGPITIGDITYIPGNTGGGAGSVLNPSAVTGGGGSYPNGVVQSIMFVPANAQ